MAVAVAVAVAVGGAGGGVYTAPGEEVGGGVTAVGEVGCAVDWFSEPVGGVAPLSLPPLLLYMYKGGKAIPCNLSSS